MKPQIVDYINKNGPMPINIFIETALNTGKDSYYASSHKILGSQGDFITAPEISQLFGEMIGMWVYTYASEFFQSKKFTLCELGPGKGTLMSDLLRSISKTTNLLESVAKVQLLEINKTLINFQQKALKNYPLETEWINTHHQLSKGKKIIIANEFFDALPVIQYVRREKRWYELMVNLKKDSNDLYISDEPIDQKTQDMLQSEYSGVPVDGIIEILHTSNRVIADICDDIAKHGGAALVIDYGFTEEMRDKKSYISTLQSIKNHKFNNIFNHIGDADLTTQVNFSQLIKTAHTHKCKTRLLTQSEFLHEHGIELRKELLKRGANKKQQQRIDSEYRRLTSPNEMGNLFKTLIISSN